MYSGRLLFAQLSDFVPLGGMAISVYVLVAIVKKKLNVPRNLSEILQILSFCLFGKVPFYKVLTTTHPENTGSRYCNQLPLCDL